MITAIDSAFNACYLSLVWLRSDGDTTQGLLVRSPAAAAAADRLSWSGCKPVSVPSSFLLLIPHWFCSTTLALLYLLTHTPTLSRANEVEITFCCLSGLPYFAFIQSLTHLPLFIPDTAFVCECVCSGHDGGPRPLFRQGKAFYERNPLSLSLSIPHTRHDGWISLL